MYGGYSFFWSESEFYDSGSNDWLTHTICVLFQVIWQYVMGMLTNLESLPLDRIHSMLKMFAMQGPGSECSIHQLKGFLDKKVKDQKLLFTGGVYRLPKPGS